MTSNSNAYEDNHAVCITSQGFAREGDINQNDTQMADEISDPNLNSDGFSNFVSLY